MSLFRRAAPIAALLAIAACAPQSPSRTQEQAGPAEGASYGTIVAIRPVARPADNTGVATILQAIGGAGAESLPARGQPVEFIVHEDFAAAPISVVLGDAGGFRAGDRVVVVRGTRTRLARGAPPPPAGS